MTNKNTKIISYVIVLAVIVLGIFYWYKAPTPDVVTAPLIEEGTTEGWKTFKSEEYGFQFDYPEEAEVQDIEGVLFAFVSAKLPLDLSGGPAAAGAEYDLEGFQFAMDIIEKNDITIDITKSVENQYISKKVDLPNITAYRIQTIEPQTPTVIFVEDAKLPGKYVLINYLASPDIDQVADRSVDKILATWKFTK